MHWANFWRAGGAEEWISSDADKGKRTDLKIGQYKGGFPQGLKPSLGQVINCRS
jgi:hypothetical protein